MPSVDLPGSPAPATGDGAFLPLTLSTLRAGEFGSLADRARRAEAAAALSWQALLGDCACAHRRRFPDQLRELTEAAGAYAGRTHRARVAEFERWAADALAEGDGEEFAEACAGYDAALAHALITLTDRTAD
ncbi:hypothetical protein [Pseudonocardia acaciae]|uniref:hypothetical protein n=1 Tax=Pseudonocardia acaciae TaxID=551276 RepID=UPI0006887024|nr:hypothetical protein [Pseudonocardia acaciae]